MYTDSVDSLEQSIATVDRYTDPHESTCLVILAKKAGRYPVSYCVDKIQARWVLKSFGKLFRDVIMEYNVKEV